MIKVDYETLSREQMLEFFDGILCRLDYEYTRDTPRFKEMTAAIESLIESSVSQNDMILLFKTRWEKEVLRRGELLRSIEDEFSKSSDEMTKDNEAGKDTTLYTGYIWGLLFCQRKLTREKLNEHKVTGTY